MTIKKIEVENFGKFSGRLFTFKPGFNIIFGNNEDGKSTLMAFIKLMFYGSSSGKSPDISKNIRKKYTPWSGAAMSGAIEFEHNGEDFRLQKELGKTPSGDKITVTNLQSGEKVSVPDATDAGQYFFNMNFAEFERSVFVDNHGAFSSESSADSLAIRISNLSVSGDESTSHTEVFSRITAAKEELVSKNGKRGRLVDEQSKLERLKYNLDLVVAQNNGQQQLFSDINALKKEISDLEYRIESHNLAQKVKTAKKDIAVFTELTEKFNAQNHITQKLNSFALSPVELQGLLQEGKNLLAQCETFYSAESKKEDMISDREFLAITESNKRISVLDEDLDFIDKSIRQSENILKQRIVQGTRKRKLLSYIPLGISAIAAVLSVVLNPTILWLSIPILLIGLGLFGILRHNINKKVLNTLSVQLSKQDFENKLRHLSFYSEELSEKSTDEILNRGHAMRNGLLTELSEKLSQYGCSSMEELRAKINSVQSTGFATFTASLKATKLRFIQLVSEAKNVDTFENAKTVFNEIESLLDDFQNLQHDIETLSKAVFSGKVSYDFAVSQLKSLSDFVADTEIDHNAITENPTELNFILKQKRQQLEELQQKIKLPEVTESQLVSQISDTTETLSALTDRYKSLSIASDVLEQAVSEMSKGLGTHLNKKTGEYLNLMSGGKYSDVIVSRDLNIETRCTSTESYHEWKYLSSGTVDRLYLALRLAATDIIAEKHNTLPLFLDDILAQYDSENCRRTLAFLDRYHKESGAISQLFFFTCHNHISDMANEIITDTNKINL